MSDIEKLTYSIPDAADAIGVSHDLIYKLLDRGLPSLKIGTRRVIVKTALIDWLNTHANSVLSTKNEDPER